MAGAEEPAATLPVSKDPLSAVQVCASGPLLATTTRVPAGTEKVMGM